MKRYQRVFGLMAALIFVPVLGFTRGVSSGATPPAVISLVGRDPAIQADQPYLAEALTGNPHGGIVYSVEGVVYKRDQHGTRSKVAGNGLHHYSGDNGPARAAGFYKITSIGVTAAGDIYVTDCSLERLTSGCGGIANRIRKIGADGIVSLVAGNDDVAVPANGARAMSTPFEGSIHVTPNGRIFY